MPNKSIRKSSRKSIKVKKRLNKSYGKSIKVKKRVNKTSKRRGGGAKSKTAKKFTSPKANSAELRDMGLERVNPAKIIPCSNKKFGCEVKPFKKFECFKGVKINKHTTKPDSIYLRNSAKGKGTRKLKTPIVKVFDGFFDCSHFED